MQKTTMKIRIYFSTLFIYTFLARTFQVNAFGTPEDLLEQIRDNLITLHTFQQRYDSEAVILEDGLSHVRKLEQASTILSPLEVLWRRQRNECADLHASLDRVFKLCFVVFEQVGCFESIMLDSLCKDQCLPETLDAFLTYTENNCTAYEDPFVEITEDAATQLRPTCQFDRDCCSQFSCQNNTCVPPYGFHEHKLRASVTPSPANSTVELFHPAKGLIFYEFVCAKEDVSGGYCFSMLRGRVDYHQCASARGLGCCLPTYKHLMLNCLPSDAPQAVEGLPTAAELHDWALNCGIEDETLCSNVDLSRASDARGGCNVEQNVDNAGVRLGSTPTWFCVLVVANFFLLSFGAL